jgi:penicillin-binding protein 1C
MRHESWFILPPAMEWFYKSKNPEYKTLPPFAPGCTPDIMIKSMAIIYPRIYNSKILIPKNIDGSLSETIFEIAHRRNTAIIYWHLDEQYLGFTSTFHKMALQPSIGNHILTLVDENGETLVTKFEIIGK